MASDISGLLMPAVIKVDVLVAEILQTNLNELVDRFLNQLFIDRAAELIPGVPAHLGHETKAIIESANSGGEKYSSEIFHFLQLHFLK